MFLMISLLCFIDCIPLLVVHNVKLNEDYEIFFKKV